MRKPDEFSFAKYARADAFDEHINKSIRGNNHLREDCVRFSQYFIQPKTQVIDLGCSSGALLRDVRDYNVGRFEGVKYVGLDVEAEFAKQWKKLSAANLKFFKKDARKFSNKNASLIFSLFVFQFLPEQDRLPLVKKIYDALTPGGAFIISEKVLAKNAKFQDMLAMTYYDFKKQSFSEKEILDKEASIRNQMKLWSEFKLFEMLRAAGFASSHTQLFWRNHLFVGIVAMKPASYR